jgi:hypothetical protein
VEFRRLLIGNSRSFDIQFGGRAGVDFELVTVWKRGDSLAQARARLDAIQIDPEAGRAPRDGMLPAFEGLDHWMQCHVAYFDLVGVVVGCGVVMG